MTTNTWVAFCVLIAFGLVGGIAAWLIAPKRPKGGS